jgi:hypothetical protein
MNPTALDPHDEEDDMIRRYIAEAGDPRVDPRPEHVAMVRSRLLERLGPPPSARRWPARLLVGSGLAAAAAAVFAIAAFSRPTIAWAQVAEALHGRPWVHGKMVGPDGGVIVEQWLSANRELASHRAAPETTFHDYKKKIFTKYVAAENVVYRLPEPPEGAPEDVNFLRQVLDLLNDPKGPTKFPFPGMELIGQTRREIEENGKKWHEIELTLQVAGGSRGGPIAARIRIDPATKLPSSLAMEAEDGKWYTASIDYPDRGPADIHDLGAPRTAKVVNRVPLDEVGRVLAKLKEGRLQFDDYCAFVVEDKILPVNHLPRVIVYRVRRKGLKWRIDELRANPADWTPPAEADLKWWKEHEDDLVFIPRAICDGKFYWDYYMSENWTPGMPAPPIGSGKTVGPNQLNAPADDPVLPFWCQDLLPEQTGHPAAGLSQPDPTREFLVDPKPSDGPPGTIVLRGRDTKAPAEGGPDWFRLWLDPEANYLSLRSEIRVAVPKNPTKVAYIDTHIIEALARSPKGFWYPKVVRHVAQGGPYEMLRRFSVNFEAPLPDELFQPLK